MKFFFPVMLYSTLVLLTGCSTVKRNPIPASEVRFSDTIPSGAQFVCDVTWHTYSLAFDWQSALKKSFASQAAKKGANVVVMDETQRYEQHAQAVGNAIILAPVKFEFWGKAYFVTNSP
jgi:hypothetical protein